MAWGAHTIILLSIDDSFHTCRSTHIRLLLLRQNVTLPPSEERSWFDVHKHINSKPYNIFGECVCFASAFMYNSCHVCMSSAERERELAGWYRRKRCLHISDSEM